MQSKVSNAKSSSSVSEAAEPSGGSSWASRLMTSMRTLYSSILTTLTGRGGSDTSERLPEARELEGPAEPQALTVEEVYLEEPEVCVTVLLCVSRLMLMTV